MFIIVIFYLLEQWNVSLLSGSVLDVDSVLPVLKSFHWTVLSAHTKFENSYLGSWMKIKLLPQPPENEIWNLRKDDGGQL